MAKGTKSEGMHTHPRMIAALVAGMILAGLAMYVATSMLGPNQSTPKESTRTQIVYDNSTVYRNTTTNTTMPIYHNTTV